jgi:DNA replication and repair protein RecF
MSLIAHVVLQDYRNYRVFEFKVNNPIVVLWGDNGAGKTNILEAISLFGGGRGLRSASKQEMTRLGSNAWSVHIETEDGNALGLGFESQDSNDKKHIRINSADYKSPTAFSEYLSLIWLTPEHDRLFISSPSSRRKFFDRLCYSIYPTHATRLNRYERLLRERNQLLKNFGSPDWLNAIEQSLAEEAKHITQTRLELSELLNTFQNQLSDVFPRFTCKITPDDTITGDFEEFYVQSFRTNRQYDREHGGAQCGPQRSDWSIAHQGKNMEAPFCSTGEQKMLLISLILSFLYGLQERGETQIILLLDDIISHLDLNHRMLLFQEVYGFEKNKVNMRRSIQTWITGNDRSAFDFLDSKADFIEIKTAA